MAINTISSLDWEHHPNRVFKADYSDSSYGDKYIPRGVLGIATIFEGTKSVRGSVLVDFTLNNISECTETTPSVPSYKDVETSVGDYFFRVTDGCGTLQDTFLSKWMKKGSKDFDEFEEDVKMSMFAQFSKRVLHKIGSDLDRDLLVQLKADDEITKVSVATPTTPDEVAAVVKSLILAAPKDFNIYGYELLVGSEAYANLLTYNDEGKIPYGAYITKCDFENPMDMAFAKLGVPEVDVDALSDFLTVVETANENGKSYHIKAKAGVGYSTNSFVCTNYSS